MIVYNGRMRSVKMTVKKNEMDDDDGGGGDEN